MQSRLINSILNETGLTESSESFVEESEFSNENYVDIDEDAYPYQQEENSSSGNEAFLFNMEDENINFEFENSIPGKIDILNESNLDIENLLMNSPFADETELTYEEFPGTSNAETFLQISNEFESIETRDYEDQLADNDSFPNETFSQEFDFSNDEAEIEYDIPTPSLSSPVASASCDLSIAVTRFELSQRQKIKLDLLSPLNNKKAIEWNTTFLSKIKIDPKHVLTDLERYIDIVSVKQAIDNYNKANPSAQIARGTSPVDAVFAEAVHQFQKKIYFDASSIDGKAGPGTLHSLGIISFPQDPKKLAVNNSAKAELKNIKIKVLINGTECNYSNWFSFTYNPSFLGKSFNRPVHYLLLKQLRIAESYLLNSTRFKGDNLVEMGTKLGLSKSTEEHAGGRLSGGGMHTFGLALDIDHANNPWIGAGWISKPKDEIYNKLSDDKRKRLDSVLNEKYRILDILKKASGQKLYGNKISVYLNHIGETKGADTKDAYNELKQRNDEFKAYLKSNPSELSYWQKSATFQHGTASNGFLNLDPDLVYALRQIGNLGWGAIDFGPGEGADGDIMHFDTRTLETGRIINLSKSTRGGDPVKTHPYLLKEEREVKEVDENEDFFSEIEKWDEHEDGELNEWEEDAEDENSEEELFEGFVPSVPVADIRKRIDEYLDFSNTEYTLPDGSKVQARSQFRYGWKGQSLVPEDAKVLIKKTLSRSKAGAKFVSGNKVAIHYAAYGRATPAQIKKITQALIDSGEFEKIRAGDSSSSDPQLIRMLQRKFGVGIDCAGYVQLAFIKAYTGSDNDPAKIRKELGLKERRGDENLGSLPSRHFKKLDVTDAQTGDLLILNPRAGEIDNAEHTVIIVDHTSSGNVHSFIVDASWGTDMYGVDAGGIGRRTLFYDADKKIWWDKHPLDDTDANQNSIGPYGGHPVQGVYRPKVKPASDKEFLEADEYDFEGDGEPEDTYETGEKCYELEPDNSELEFENIPYTVGDEKFEFEEKFSETYEDETADGSQDLYSRQGENIEEAELDLEEEKFPEQEVDFTNEYNVDSKYGVTGYLNVSAIKNQSFKTGVFIPAGYTQSGKVDVIIYLHGLYDKGDYKYGMAYYWKNYSNIREHFYLGNRNAILIAPALGSNPQVSNLVFKYKNGFDQYVSSCIKELITRNQLSPGSVVNRIILAAHSAGGYPMSAILRMPNGLNANIIECWCFDCFYNYQWEKVLESNSAKPFYHYWAFTLYGKISSPGVRGDGLEKRFKNLKNIQPAKGIHHREVIEYAWKNEINNRAWFTPLSSGNTHTSSEASDFINQLGPSSLSYEQHFDEESRPYPTAAQKTGTNVYLTLSGQKQGNITGSVTRKGKEGSIAVYQLRHELISPRDVSSGLATGRRQRKPLVIMKEIDTASVKLLQAFTTDENLKQVVINFWRPTAAGTETNYYRITLTNAGITGISQEIPDFLTNKETKFPPLEKIEFTYQKIEWAWLDKMSLVATYDWGTRG